DEVLREQVALLRQNFPMTLLASLATALGGWVTANVATQSALRNSVSNCYQSRLIQPETAGLLIFHGLHDVFHPSHHRK
ncbi:MAG: hypothetical protein B7Z52_05385, partial [Burkholderiales bacterium 12-64-5]